MTALASAQTTASRSRTALVFPLIAVAVVYLYFFAGAYGGVYLAAIRLSGVVVAAGALLLWLAVGWRRPAWRPKSRLMPVLAIAVGTLAVSTLTSRNPRISLDYVGYAVLLSGLYLLLVAVLRDAALRPRMGVLLVGLAAAVGGWYLIAVVGDWVAWWQMVGHVAVPPLRPMYEGLTFGNPGLVAAMAVLTALAAAAHLGGAGRAGWAAAATLGVLAGIVVVLSGTRGAWVAMGATLVAAAVLAAGLAAGRDAVTRLVGSTRGRLAIAAVAVVGVLAAVVLGPGLVDRVLSGGDGGRTSYWAAAIRMFETAPLTGVGPGMWAPERILFTSAPEIDYYIPHAHNLYFQTAAELGVLGLVAGVAIIVLVGRLVLDAMRGADGERRRWAVVAILATVYLGTHQLFDLYVGMPSALFVFAVPFAWLDATSPEGAGPETAAPGVRGARATGGARVAAPLALALLLTVAWTGRSEGPALTFANAQAAADAGDWQTAAADSRIAAVSDPSLTPYRLMAGLGAAHLGQEASGDLQAAAEADGLPIAWLDLAAARLTAGDPAGARAALDNGMRLGEQQPALEVVAGYLDERLGDSVAADRWYVSALTALPRLAAASYWHLPVRADRWRTIAEGVAAALDPASRVDFWVSAGDLAKARAAAGGIADPTARQVAALGVAAWGGDSSASARLRSIATEQPKDTDVVGWCARLAAHAGDAATAAGYRTWLEIVAPYSSVLGLEARITNQLTPGASPAGAIWMTYGIYTYRRPTPADLLVPGLPHAEYYVGLPDAAR